MLRSVYIALALLVGVGTSSSVYGASMSVQVRGPKGSVRINQPKDGYSLLMVFQPAVPGFVKAIKRQGVEGLRVSTAPVGRRGEEVLLRFASPIAKQAVKRRGRRVSLEVSWKTREEILREHIIETLKVPVPSTFVGYRFDAAEGLMRSGDFEDALASYKELAAKHELRAWSQLRLSDIALLNGDVPGACRRYGATNEAYGVRMSGMLARLRRQVLACDLRDGPPADWDVLLERADRIPGRIGKFLRSEVIWAIEQVASVDEVDRAINLIENLELQHRGTRRKLRRIRDVLIARGIRLVEDPLRRASMCYRHRSALMGHSEAYSLRFLCAKSFRGLSLLDKAVAGLKVLSKARQRNYNGALWEARNGRAQALFELAHAYNDLGDPDYVYATLVRFKRKFGYPPPTTIQAEPKGPSVTFRDLPLGKLIDSIDSRAYALDRAVRASGAGGEQRR